MWGRDVEAMKMEDSADIVQALHEIAQSFREIKFGPEGGTGANTVGTSAPKLDLGPFNEALKEGTIHVRAFGKAVNKSVDVLYAMQEKVGKLEFTAGQGGGIDLEQLAAKLATQPARVPAMQTAAAGARTRGGALQQYYPSSSIAKHKARMRRARMLKKRLRRTRRAREARTATERTSNQVAAIRRFQRMEATQTANRRASNSRTVRNRGKRRKREIVAKRKRASWLKRAGLGLLIGGGAFGAISPATLLAVGSRLGRTAVSGGAEAMAGIGLDALDNNRRFAAYSPQTALAFQNFNIREMMRTADLSRALAPSSVQLVNSVDGMRASMKDYDRFTNEAGNYLGTFASRTAGAAFRTMSGVFQTGTDAIQSSAASWMLENAPPVAGSALGGFGAVVATGLTIKGVGMALGALGLGAGGAVAGALTWPALLAAGLLGAGYAAVKEMASGDNKFEQNRLERLAMLGKNSGFPWFQEIMQTKKFAPRPVFIP